MGSPSLAIPFFERSLKNSKKAQFDYRIVSCLVSKGKETPYFAPAPSSAARSADACTKSIIIPPGSGINAMKLSTEKAKGQLQ